MFRSTRDQLQPTALIIAYPPEEVSSFEEISKATKDLDFISTLAMIKAPSSPN